MKKCISLYTLIICLPLLFSCSEEIPFEDRYESINSVKVMRNILLEDFTGQLCSNCPDAHQVISELQAQYGEHVIAVAMHAGHFGIAEGGNESIVGLMQPEGNTYADYWGVEAYPAGLINRTSGILKHTEWASYVRQALEKAPKATINVIGEFSADSSIITIRTELIPHTTIIGKLQLWITESRISALQQKGGDLIADYKHHHVYRASVNGIWGENILLEEGVASNLEHQITLKDNWSAKDLSIVAFLYNDTEGVIQAEEHSFTKGGLDDNNTSGDDNNNTGAIDVKALTFLCGGDTITNGSTFISSKMDEAYTAMGLTRFVPEIDIVGNRDGNVVVNVKSLNKALVEICAFGGCQMTLPHLDYQATTDGNISAGIRLPLDIHYTPSGNNSTTHRAEALVSVYYEDKPNEIAKFTLVMTNE